MTEQRDTEKFERALRKIKRCLALSKSPNEHEAAVAMRQAQALMREYRLTVDEVAFSDVKESMSLDTPTIKRPVWELYLAKLVASVFGCAAIVTKCWSDKKRGIVEHTTFVGVAPNNEIALYAHDTLLRKLRLARKEYKADLRSGRWGVPKYSFETTANHFAMGWVAVIESKLKQLLPTGEDEPVVDGAQPNQLIAVQVRRDKELVSQYLVAGNVGRKKATGYAEPERSVVIAGAIAASNVDLHVAVSGDGRSPQAGLEET